MVQVEIYGSESRKRLRGNGNGGLDIAAKYILILKGQKWTIMRATLKMVTKFAQITELGLNSGSWRPPFQQPALSLSCPSARNEEYGKI
jgi:hypothetical protein